ncbi:FxsA family protein [Hansschlegelia zhihuaiae]|uniref:FxsA family protein n=1 Tax=Hansschlegelia zhihuaiae TaxID=405005 RepID=A0A4Q0MAK9_9HYPH|nr:FxsA family protein [Hansschlegelia zhihuaiae]RXF70300.1 FxsA family protein [Hansschlegelia zhihuaiae]
MPRLLGLVLLLPVIELIAFALVAMAIGLGKAVLLQLAISLIGVAMLGSLITEAKAKARRNGGLVSFALDQQHGLRGLAGLLFAIPGFVTDALGVLALVPEARRRIRRLIVGPERPTAATRTPRGPARPAEVGTVDLDTREWREVEPAGGPKT